MAALVCEFCGGSLITKAGGICECDSCGMQFDKTWVKEKIQEIRGTVKVEGTVEVTGKVQVDGGTVKVEGGVNIESLLKRGWLALEDKKWDDAVKFFDEALNLDAECAEAYLGKTCRTFVKTTADALLKGYATDYCIATLEADRDFQKAIRFSDPQSPTSPQRRVEEHIRRDREQREAAAKELAAVRENIAPAQHMLAADRYHAAALRADGTVAVVGSTYDGEGDVSSSRDIVEVAVNYGYTIGLRADGTVVAEGKNDKGQCDVGSWRDIVAIAAGYGYTVGLRADGTVIAVGNNEKGQCNVESWRDIVAIAAGDSCTVGLCADGTAVLTGKGDPFSKYDVSSWRDMVAIAAGDGHIVGLRADGTVAAVGNNYGSQCDVFSWRNIVAVAAGARHTLGLRADGTVVVQGEGRGYGECRVESWRNIVSIAAGGSYSMGLRADGTVVTVGYRADEKDVSGWKLFNRLETLEQERAEAKARRAEQARIEAERRAERERLEAERKAKERAERKAALESEKTALTIELSNLKGMFSGKRRKEIEARLAEIDTELKNL